MPPLFNGVLFQERLFYRSDVAGLYRDGILRDEIRNIIDLDGFTAAQVIGNNTKFNSVQSAFYATPSDRFIAVNVSGDTGAERFRVVVNGQVLGTFQASTDIERYALVAQQDFVAGDSVKVEFLNDVQADDFDRNLNVRSIQVGDVVVDPSTQRVRSTGTWLASDGIQTGFGRGNYLHVNGFFRVHRLIWGG